MGRPPTAPEREFMEQVLAREFEGVDALRQQWASALVHPSCHCGCGSFGFEFARDDLPRAHATGLIPVHLEIVDGAGVVIGGVAVLLRDGLLDDVDIHSANGAPLPSSALAHLRWLL